MTKIKLNSRLCEHPFGMIMPGRNFSPDKYCFGFNGQEKIDEISGNGNHNTALFWEYDTRLARRWNIDPILKPNESSYFTLGGNPIWNIDPSGDDWYKNNSTGKVEWIETKFGEDKEGYTYLGEHRYWNNFFTKGHYVYYNLLGRGDLGYQLGDGMEGSDDGTLGGGPLGGTYGFNHGGKQLLTNTVVGIGTAGLGEVVLGAKAIWAFAAYEVGTKTLAAQGDLTKVDWFDVVIGTVAKRLGVPSGEKDFLCSIVDAKISDGEIKVVFVNKDLKRMAIDLSYSAFKSGVSAIAKSKGYSKIKEEQIKLAFDQIKTEINKLLNEKNKK